MSDDSEPREPREDAEVIDLVAVIDGKARAPARLKPNVRFPRRNKLGVPLPHLENTEALLRAYGVTVRFNLMTHEAEHAFDRGNDFAGECERNASEAQVREWANEQKVYKSARFTDQMTIIIARRAYHPVADWIRSATWDGEDRILPLLASLEIAPAFVKANPGHALRILKAWLVTGAKAALLPADCKEGIAAQGVLVLQGPQGKGKTRWLMSLVPAGTGWAKEGVSLDPTDRDSKQQATCAWIVELGELDGTFRKADIAHLKGFLTSRVDTYRKAYAKTHENIARRTVFVASVNAATFLVDDTGSRRFWTLPILSANPEHGIDLQQLWAQAAYLAETEPELGWLDSDESDNLNRANKSFETLDPIVDDIYRVFRVHPPAPVDVPVSWLNYEQIRKAIRPAGVWTRGDTISLGKALERIGVVEKKGHEAARLFALEIVAATAPPSSAPPQDRWGPET